MKLVLCAGLVLAFSTVAASADQFAGMYGNTVNITHGDGKTSTVWVNADHTWEQHRDGKTVRGTYSWKDDTHFCIVVTDPPPGADEKGEECNEISGNHKVGDTWSESDGKGHTTTFTLTAGR